MNDGDVIEYIFPPIILSPVAIQDRNIVIMYVRMPYYM